MKTIKRKSLQELDKLYDEMFSDNYIIEVEYAQAEKTNLADEETMRFKFDDLVIQYFDTSEQRLSLYYNDEDVFEKEDAKLLSYITKLVENNYHSEVRINLYYKLSPWLLKKTYIFIPEKVAGCTNGFDFCFYDIEEYIEKWKDDRQWVTIQVA